MTKTIIHLIILFVILVIAQALIFNNLCLWGVAMPLVFIYFIMRLPVSFSPIAVMSLSFLLGLTIDIFSDTLGVNALACTILGASRKVLLKLYFPREEDMPEPIPSVRTLGLGVYVKYAITVSLFYCLVYFLIETMTLADLPRMLLRIVASTVITFVFIMCFEIIGRTGEKRL